MNKLLQLQRSHGFHAVGFIFIGMMNCPLRDISPIVPVMLGFINIFMTICCEYFAYSCLLRYLLLIFFMIFQEVVDEEGRDVLSPAEESQLLQLQSAGQSRIKIKIKIP